MNSPRVNNYGDREFEIEKVAIPDVVIKRKELLPVFDHFHSIKSGWSDRGLTGGRSEPYQAEGKISQESVIRHPKMASLSSTESSKCGSSRTIEQILDLDQINGEKSYIPTCHGLNDLYHERREATNVESAILNKNSSTKPPEHPKNMDTHVDNCIENGLPSTHSCLLPVRRIFIGEAPPLSSNKAGDVSMLTTESYDLHMNVLMRGPTLPTTENSVKFELSFQEGHCKALDLNGCERSTEVVTDDVDSSSSHCEREKPKEDGKNDEFLGGIFAFSEEG